MTKEECIFVARWLYKHEGKESKTGDGFPKLEPRCIQGAWVLIVHLGWSTFGITRLLEAFHAMHYVVAVCTPLGQLPNLEYVNSEPVNPKFTAPSA